ncbi:unnamed protein product [Ceutorhynchus assimilis]|uniref:Uncharacterized protein n=1 Tax=Ceutorhynchus assimilis TaxID=467358 RepID=A0A9N9MX25_9CUCU|nr:unnamed protein product [Ceutorhynchus assimilis]
MNRKAYSVLFSCLLATTFFHEYNARGLIPPVPAWVKGNGPVYLERIREKRNTNDSPLTLSSPAENLLVVLNATAAVALVIDINVNLFVLLDGNSGSGVCVNKDGSKGAHIPGGLWNSADGTLDDFLISIGADLSGLLTIAGSITFTLETVTIEVLEVVTSLVICLVDILDVELLADVTLALVLVISIVAAVLDLLAGPLEGLLVLVVGVIELAVDICGLLNILQGLASVLVLVAGTLLKALAAGVLLELGVIIGAVDGLVCLVNLILQLGAHLNLSPLAGLLGNAQSLCLLIGQLGGNVSVGLSGLFLVIGNLLALIAGSIQIDVFILVLIQFVALGSQNGSSNLLGELHAELTLLLNACGKVNATGVLGGLVTIVEALLNGTLAIGGIVISVVIEVLLKGIVGPVSGLLGVVVEVLILITSVVSTALCIPQLLLILICLLDSPLGIQLLLYLGINLGRGPCICKLLSEVLSNLGGVIGLLLGGNLFGVLVGLPVIGNIVNALDVAVRVRGKISLKILLNASNVVTILIRGLLQLVTGIYIGVRAAVVTQAKQLKERCTSAAVFVHVALIVSISV